MANSRQLIEQTCKRLDLDIISLTYNPAIAYDSGGWDLQVSYKDGDLTHGPYTYGAHTANDLICDLEENWNEPEFDEQR